MIRDGNKLTENRDAAAPEYLAQFAGRHVAWNDDCTKVLAHAATEMDLYAEMDRLGLSGADCVIDFVDGPEPPAPAGLPPAQTLGGGLGPLTGLAFSPDGARLAAATQDGSVFVWDLGTGERTHQLGGGLGPLTGLAFSPDGARLAAAGWDGKVRLWEVSQVAVEHNGVPTGEGRPA